MKAVISAFTSMSWWEQLDEPTSAKALLMQARPAQEPEVPSTVPVQWLQWLQWLQVPEAARE